MKIKQKIFETIFWKKTISDGLCKFFRSFFKRKTHINQTTEKLDENEIIDFYYIGLTAYKRCGKDTAALIIKDYFESRGIKAEIYAFADILKDYVCSILNISRDELDRMKNENDTVVIKTGDSGEYKEYLMRDFLIYVGENLKKVSNNNAIWAEFVLKRIQQDKIHKKIKVAIISDVRYLSEHKLLQKEFKSYKRYFLFRIKSDLPRCKWNKNEVEVDKLENREFFFEVYNSKENINSMKNQIYNILDKEIK